MKKTTGLLLLGLGVVVVLAAVLGWVGVSNELHRGINHFMEWEWTRQLMLVGGLVVALLGLLSLRGKKKK